MISDSTLNAIEPIMDLLYLDRVNVVPHPRSMLATTVAASKSMAFQMDEGTRESFIDAWRKDLAYDPMGVTEPTKFDNDVYMPNTLHGRTIDEGAQAIFSAVEKTTAFTRTYVVRQVNSCIEMVNSKLEDAYRPVEEWEIIEASFLPIWNHPIVKEILSDLDIGDGALPNMLSGRDYAIPLPPTGEKTIADFLNSGQQSLDRAFMETLKRVGMDLNTLYQSVFGSEGRIGPNRHYLEMRNVALCQLLMVYMIEDNPWVGSGLSGGEWDLTMAVVKKNLGKSVAIYRAGGELNSDINMLVQDVDYKNHKIYVEAEVYSRWLADSQENCPEVLIGLAILNQSGVYSIDQANNLRPSALSAWQSYHSSKQQAIESNRLSVVREALLETLLGELHEMDQSLLPPGVLKPTIVDQLSVAVRSLTSYDVKDIGMTLIELICRYFYPHTGCYQFAVRYNQIATTEPNSTPEERELKATIEYITDFIAAQVVVGGV